jgi:hypothetical protein
MEVNRIIIGDIGKINQEKEKTTKWMKIIATAASMTEEERKEYSVKHFSELSEKVREGIDFMLELTWACANVLNQEAKLSLKDIEEVRVLRKP